MLFNSVEFVLFLCSVLVVFYAMPRRVRPLFLLAASYYFYAYWNVKFLALLIAITLADYGGAIAMTRLSSTTARRGFLAVCVSLNLAVLGALKYLAPAYKGLHALTGFPEPAFVSAIILPIGISFHTFQSISYLVDVYRGVQPAIRSLPHYALYIAFFPQLVAGPIVRARNFFQELTPWKGPTQLHVLRALFLMALGFFKKMVMADNLGLVADSYFSNPSQHPGVLGALSGSLAFSFQIYFDFSGYSDIAIGVALLFGFHFPENFRRPYLSASITEFWRRWHMSLSSWLRDYVYIPLGGNRNGTVALYRNLLLTMMIGGIWHGANWTFAVWGLYHGLLLAVERFGARFVPAPGPLTRPIRVVGTFILVSLGWILFRAADMRLAGIVVGQLFSAETGLGLIPTWQLVLIFLAGLLSVADERFNLEKRIVESHAVFYGLVIALLLLGIELLSQTDKTLPFVYFQF